jgi:hypothetical protein
MAFMEDYGTILLFLVIFFGFVIVTVIMGILEKRSQKYKELD